MRGGGTDKRRSDSQLVLCMALRQEKPCLVVGLHVDRTPRVSSAPEQAEGGNKGSVKEAGNDLRACTMSAEIPLDADGSHPEQAPESRVTASNMSRSLSERRAG